MGHWVKLKAADGVEIDAWRAEPKGRPRGGLVVCQEIFGVNAHIRGVAEGYAAQGYLAIAPALFDRAQRGIELGYDSAGFARGRELLGAIPREKTLLDLEAAVALAAEAGKVGVVGYCWGGTLSWVASAQSSGVAAAVGYYGSGILGLKDLSPKAPTMLHFGEKDPSSPMSGIEELGKAHPEVALFTYPAGHAFNRAGNEAWHEASAALALTRTLAFFGAHLGASGAQN